MRIFAEVAGFCIEHPWISGLIGGCIFLLALTAAVYLWGDVIEDVVD